MPKPQIPKRTFALLVIGISLVIGFWTLDILKNWTFSNSVFHHRLPHGEADQQKHADDTDPDARFGEPCSLANPAVDERPDEHHEDDEPGTQHRERAGEQLEPAE